MLGFFAAEGIATGLVERRPDRVPGLYAISVDAAGERSFTYWRDASAARTLFQPPAEVTPERLAGFDLIYLSGITLAILAAGGARRARPLPRRAPGRRRPRRVRLELPPPALARPATPPGARSPRSGR